MSEPKVFNQLEFNAAMLTAMNKMGNVMCLMHYTLLENPEYAKDIGELTELNEWSADIQKNWTKELLECHRKDLDVDTVIILESLN